MAVDDRSVVDMETNSLGEGDAFALSSEADEIVGGVEVLHAVDFLLDDRTSIEVGGDVVAGRPDQERRESAGRRGRTVPVPAPRRRSRGGKRGPRR